MSLSCGAEESRKSLKNSKNSCQELLYGTDLLDTAILPKMLDDMHFAYSTGLTDLDTGKSGGEIGPHEHLGSRGRYLSSWLI